MVGPQDWMGWTKRNHLMGDGQSPPQLAAFSAHPWGPGWVCSPNPPPVLTFKDRSNLLPRATISLQVGVQWGTQRVTDCRRWQPIGVFGPLLDQGHHLCCWHRAPGPLCRHPAVWMLSLNI